MNRKWMQLANQAKKVVDQRGGTEQLKRDADQLKGIAKGRGSVSDKAKAAAQALKEPSNAGAAGSRGSEGEPIADQQAGAVEASRRQERGERPS